jgi:hypothetical protein
MISNPISINSNMFSIEGGYSKILHINYYIIMDEA